MEKKVVNKAELQRKGAKFMSFGKDGSYGAVLKDEDKKIYYRRVSDNKYQRID